MQKINFNSLITGDSAALLIFIIFWLSLLGFTKTPFSGIHFQDDHQIITINKELSSNKISDVIFSHLKQDFKIRFRPFYYIHRIFITKVLGDNIKYWSIYTGLLAILTSYFLYKFLSLLRFSFTESILFSFLTLLGPQTCIWWRLGPAETIGIFLLSVSLFFISKSIISSRQNIYKFLSLIAITLSILSKESFLLFVPALILIYLFFYLRINKISFRIAINKNYIFLFILFIIFIFPLIFIFRNVGTDKIGYAGVSDNYFSIGFIKWTVVQIYKNIYFILIVVGFFLIILNVPVNNLKDFLKRSLKTVTDHSFILIIFLAIFLPQCALYFKSGLGTRYYTPLVLGFSLLTIYLLNIISSSSAISHTSKSSYITLIIFAIIYLNFKTIVPAAYNFTEEGLQTKTFIDNIVSHSDQKDKILFVLNPGSEYEWGFFIKTFFETKLGRKDIQFLPVYSNYSYAPHNVSKDIFIEKFKEYIIKPDALFKEKFKCIAVLPLSKDLFMMEFPTYNKSSEYACLNNFNFTVYYLNNK